MRLSVLMPCALTLLGILFVLPSRCHAAEPVKSTVVAVLARGESELAPLFEAKLAAEPGVTLVERALVDEVLAEQQIQAAFGPDGVGERVRLGKILKADVLVLVRATQETKDRELEVSVTETSGGLRLMVRPVAITKDPAQDAEAFAAAVRDGLARNAKAIREIVAVPPFVSQDLGYDFDHLTSGFAKLVEAAAMRHEGVVAVDLAEAEAIAKELAFAAPGTAVRRRMPLYMLGEFRHAGTGGERKVTIKLRAERGGSRVGPAFDREVLPDDAAAEIQAWAAGVVSDADATPRAPLEDQRAESRQLAARARELKRLGSRKEAVALFEAALLLDPQHLEVHVDVLKTIGPDVFALWVRSRGKDEQATEAFVRLYRRGLEHVEAFVARGGDLTKYLTADQGWSLFKAFRHEGGLGIEPGATPAQRELLEDAQRFEQAMCLRLIPQASRFGRSELMDFVYPAVFPLPDAEQLEMFARFIGELPDVPRSDEVARWYAEVATWTAVRVGADECKAFEARLAAGRSAAYRAAAEEFAALLPFARQGSTVQPYRPPQRTERRPDGIELTPLRLVIDGQQPPSYPQLKPLHRIGGVLRVGPATDFLWSPPDFYLMKEKGRLRWIRGLSGLGGLNHVCFDGAYVWMSHGHFRQPPSLFVLDPVTESLWNVSQAEGLPRFPEAAIDPEAYPDGYPLAAVEPGRVSIAGRLGDRGWVGIATFDRTSGKATVKVVAESREAPDPLDKEQWARPTLSFTPSYIEPLADPGGLPAARVLVGRVPSHFYPPFSRIPLHAVLVDPAGVASPEVIREQLGVFWKASRHLCRESRGAVYFIDALTPHTDTRPAIAASSARLRRMALPGPTIETIAEGLPVDTRMILPEGERWHAVEVLSSDEKPEKPPRWPTSQNDPNLRNWWIVEPGAKMPRLACTDLPAIQGIAMSAHYGLVAFVMQDPAASCVMYRVDVRPEHEK